MSLMRHETISEHGPAWETFRNEVKRAEYSGWTLPGANHIAYTDTGAKIIMKRAFCIIEEALLICIYPPSRADSERQVTLRHSCFILKKSILVHTYPQESKSVWMKMPLQI